MRILEKTGLLMLLASLNTNLAAEKTTLQKYSISDVTISGLSAGAFMAVQMHVSFSSVINGSAVFAGVRNHSRIIFVI